MAKLIIVGSGIAGLFGAIRASEKGLDVHLVSKEGLLESNSKYAQGGIAAALGSHDSPELHFADTLVAGDGLCHEPAVKVLVEDGVLRVQELLSMGVKFDTSGEELALTREGAHSQRRILHAGGDATGREIVETLTEIVMSHPSIKVRDRFFVTRLVISGGRCVGVEGFDEGGKLEFIDGDYTMLATGGTGQIYAYTTNPPTATGDGMALAFLAGAEMADMEFVQFHPTALSIPGQNPNFLISEAIRGEGAILRNADGERFMPSYDSRGELAPRDVVSRSIVSELIKSGTDHIYLDFTAWSSEKAQERFPTIWQKVTSYGLDMSRDYIPVAPAAHYYMGGTKSDLWGRTTVPGLFACGEVACTYCHGANRLGSNSLLEGLVYAARAIEVMTLPQGPWAFDPGSPVKEEHMTFKPFSGQGAQGVKIAQYASAPARGEADMVKWLKNLMWTHAGILREADGLAKASAELAEKLRGFEGPMPLSRPVYELRNMLVVSAMASASAEIREESRGGHYRLDFPHKDDRWLVHTVLRGGV